MFNLTLITMNSVDTPPVKEANPFLRSLTNTFAPEQREDAFSTATGSPLKQQELFLSDDDESPSRIRSLGFDEKDPTFSQSKKAIKTRNNLRHICFSYDEIKYPKTSCKTKFPISPEKRSETLFLFKDLYQEVKKRFNNFLIIEEENISDDTKYISLGSISKYHGKRFKNDSWQEQ